MKKIVIFLFLVFTVAIARAQGRIGYTEEEIISFYPSYTFVHGITDDGTRYIYSNDFPGRRVAYFFNDQGLSYLTIIFPDTDLDLNALVEYYNSHYVRISDTHWKAYLKDGGILDIKLGNVEGTGIVVYISAAE